MDEIDRIRHEKKKKMLENIQIEDLKGGAATANGSPVKLTDSNFNEQIQNSGVVLVDFWAEWCGPCKMLTPVIEELAKENAGKAVIAKLNVDNNQRTAKQYNVTGIPTMLIFKNGQLVDKIVGYTEKNRLQTRIDQLL